MAGCAERSQCARRSRKRGKAPNEATAGDQTPHPALSHKGGRDLWVSGAEGSSRAVDQEADAVEWRIFEEPASRLDEYWRVPIAFRVDRVLEVIPVDNGLGGIHL